MTSVPVDRQHIAGESTVNQDVAAKAVERTVEEKPDDSASSPASPPNGHPIDSSTQGTVEEPGARTAGATTEAGEEMSQTTSPSPGESKRLIRMPLVPVNVASEGTGNGHPQNGDETASTHKPLGFVNKPVPSPSASETIPVTREPEQPESQVPATSDIPPVESSVQQEAGSSGEPGEKSIEEGKGVAPAPAPSGEEPKAPAPPQEAVPPKAVPQTSDAGEVTKPTREEKPIESAALPKANGGTSHVRSSMSSAKTFPRASRESSDSRKSVPNGSHRKKKTSFLQKIKQIFTHDKEKKSSV